MKVPQNLLHLLCCLSVKLLEFVKQPQNRYKHKKLRISAFFQAEKVTELIGKCFSD